MAGGRRGRSPWRSWPLLGLLALLLLVVGAYFLGAPDRTGAAAVADLPAEVVETLELIENGGPYPYDRDGAVFENREGLLPDRPAGYYREYTVPTPGEDDRGPRRLVTGADGEVYYTADHYDSFVRIADP